MLGRVRAERVVAAGRGRVAVPDQVRARSPCSRRRGAAPRPPSGATSSPSRGSGRPVGRCRRSGRSPGGRAGRSATGRTRRSRRGTLPAAAAAPRWRDTPWRIWTYRCTFCSMQRDAALEAVFKPVRPPTTFEETVERLGTAIRLGLLPAGSRLPAERDLAGAARDLALDAARGADHAGAERPSRRAAGAHRGHVRRRAAAAGGEGRKPLGERGLGGARLPGRGRGRRHDPGGRAGRARPARAPRRAGRARWPSATDFEDYRRADIRFHIGVAEAAQLAPAGERR